MFIVFAISLTQLEKAFIIYLAGGFICNIAGPLANQVRHEMADLRRQTVPVDKVAALRRKLFYSEIIFRTLILLLYPLAYIMCFFDLRREKMENLSRIVRQEQVRKQVAMGLDQRKKAILENRSFTYFSESAGGGTVRCHGCGFHEEVVSHSPSESRQQVVTRGFQCQKCGRFHQVSFLGSRPITPYLRCSCGGELSNVKPLFCPRCKARDVMYMREYAI